MLENGGTNTLTVSHRADYSYRTCTVLYSHWIISKVPLRVDGYLLVLPRAPGVVYCARENFELKVFFL